MENLEVWGICLTFAAEKYTQTMNNEETNKPQSQPEIVLEEGFEQPLNIGMVSNYNDSEETRILLTPEACGILVSAGNIVTVEAGVGIDVDFSDEDYARYGVRIAPREQVLALPVVLSYRPLQVADIRRMQPGGTNLCMLDNTLFDRKVVDEYLSRNITLGCLNNMLSHNGEPIFANVLDEIDGRVAIMYAQENLSFLGGGKGVLLAGVAGINPCEVLIIGTGTKVMFAAMAAIAAGASVTVMDNDISSLQEMRDFCGDRLTTCAVHPRVLLNRVKTADVILLDHCTRDFEMPRTRDSVMKDNVYLLDLADTDPSQSVPRTVAMAMSNILVNFFEEMALKNGVDGMIVTTPGMQEGIVTYRGKLVDKLIASYLGTHGMDLGLLLAGGN